MGFQFMLILGLLSMYFDAVVVFVTKFSLLFRLVVAILCSCPKKLVESLFLTLFYNPDHCACALSVLLKCWSSLKAPTDCPCLFVFCVVQENVFVHKSLDFLQSIYVFGQ